MKESSVRSSVLRAADGLPGRVRSTAERLSRAASCGRTSGRCLRSAAPPFSDLPAPEAPTGAAPPILAAMTTRARRRRVGRLPASVLRRWPSLRWRPECGICSWRSNGARRGALPGGDARHMLLQDSLLGVLAVQLIWGLCWVASRKLGTLDQR